MDVLQKSLGKEGADTKIRLRAGIYQEADADTDIEYRFDRAKIACDRIRGDYSPLLAQIRSLREELKQMND